MTAYTRGDRYEKLVADRLRADGYSCWQARGSHGAADLIALKPGGHILLIQVKGGHAAITGTGWNDLYDIASILGAIPLVADFPKRGQLRYRQVLARHVPHSKHWHSQPWHPDEATP